MYSRRDFMKLAGASLVASGCGTSLSSAMPNKTRPNIILMFIDDMGWGDLSCFGGTVQTENIDRFASEGIRFEQFYVNSPICSPSRVAISTGQYPQRWKISSYLSNRNENKKRGMAQWLDPKAPMLARSLKQAGYATGHFGKWHMGGQRDVGEAPLINEYGFDESLTNFEGLGPRVLPMLDAYDGKPPRKYALGSDNLGHGPIIWEDRSKVTTSFLNGAIEFIKKAQAEDKPFYVNLWPDDVHSPFFPPEGTRGDNKKRTLYNSVLDAMDKQFAVLFDMVKNDKKLRDNTLIIFCSDNGPERGAGVAGHLKGLKTMLYEGGIRSPLIVWSPSMVNKKKVGTVNKTSFMAAVDLTPTILDIVGIKPPQGVQYDGQPMTDVLLGRSERSRTKPLFFRRPPDRDKIWGQDNLPDLAVRQGDWKLLCEYDGSLPQLYNLIDDPSEKNNLAAKHPDRVKQLTEMVIEWHKSMPTDNGATYGK